jgi:hypothetical protein
MPKPLTYLELQQPQLKEALRRQLAKDLNLRLQDLPKQNLAQWLGQYLATQGSTLPRLLYQIDISERMDLPENFAMLAQKILEREAQKVLFREQFAGRL